MYSFKICIISVLKSVLSDMSIAASVLFGFRCTWNIKDIFFFLATLGPCVSLKLK